MVSGKTSLDVNKILLPTEAPSDYTAGAFCIKLSPAWAGILIGLTDYLHIRGFWVDKTGEQWQQIQRWVEEVGSLVKLCEDCEECEECEEPGKPGTGGGSGGLTVGAFGMTLCELEDFIMGWSLRAQLKIIDGVLHYWDCCDWIPVEGATSVQSTSKPSAQMTLQEWIDAGNPPLPTTGVIQHQNPAYTTPGSIQCAKATAIVNEIYEALGAVKDALTIFDIGTPTVAGVGAAILAYVGSGGWAAVAGVVAVVYSAVSEYGVDELIEDLDNFRNDDDTRQQIICDLIPQMSVGETVTDGDIQDALTYIGDIAGDHPFQFQSAESIIEAFPMFFWKEKTQEDVADTECECSPYLPSGYIPPSSAQSVGTFIGFREAWDAGSLPTAHNLTDTPLENWPTSGADGALVAGGYKATYIGVNNTRNFYRAGLLFEFSVPVEIDEISISWTATVQPEDTRWWAAGVEDSDDLWSAWGGSLEVAATGLTGTVTAARVIAASTHLGIVVQARKLQAQGHTEVTFSNIRLTGRVNGVGFINQPIGAIVAP